MSALEWVLFVAYLAVFLALSEAVLYAAPRVARWGRGAWSVLSEAVASAGGRLAARKTLRSLGRPAKAPLRTSCIAHTFLSGTCHECRVAVDLAWILYGEVYVLQLPSIGRAILLRAGEVRPGDPRRGEIHLHRTVDGTRADVGP